MATRQQVVDEARTWLGTRWQHQGRLRGVGVDCAGLVVCVMRAVGADVADVEGYTRRPDGSLLDIVRARSLPADVAAAGDVAVFAWDSDPCHLAIMTGPGSIIHAFAPSRMVVEHDLDDRWRAALVCVRRVPGVI
ncbi:hypothetical protein WM08_15210 [Burkholderia ubonensis]|uniref:NlpC/P60 family protein n=1 Tax=Burkholderia ubonensis TaxID=101571 RepID=UPI00075FD51B|nr:NlpC/P60 family protein [Burkholderia ubonensis]KWI90202.1 hypothetical protein WM08_15210 [Burkholderia ubonensis]